jgi:hypothetical protein
MCESLPSSIRSWATASAAMRGTAVKSTVEMSNKAVSRSRSTLPMSCTGWPSLTSPLRSSKRFTFSFFRGSWIARTRRQSTVWCHVQSRGGPGSARVGSTVGGRDRGGVAGRSGLRWSRGHRAILRRARPRAAERGERREALLPAVAREEEQAASADLVRRCRAAGSRRAAAWPTTRSAPQWRRRRAAPGCGRCRPSCDPPTLTWSRPSCGCPRPGRLPRRR